MVGLVEVNFQLNWECLRRKFTLRGNSFLNANFNCSEVILYGSLLGGLNEIGK